MVFTTDSVVVTKTTPTESNELASKSFTDTQVGGRNPYHGVVSRATVSPLPTHITTTTFTLAGNTTTIQYYYQGKLVTVSTEKTATLDDGASGTTAGIYYAYFLTDTGNIAVTKTFPGIGPDSNVIIANIVWNGTDYGLVSDERHSYNRNKARHTWAHNTVGVRYRSGITLTHNSGTGAAATFATTAGELADEDIQFSVPASSSFPSANTCRLFYQTGASTYAFVNTPATTPGYLGPNNRPYYVNTTGYVLTEMNSAVNRYINVFVYGTQDNHTPIYMFTQSVSNTIAGTNGYSSVANARAAAFPNLSGFGLSPELKPLYRLIWRADGALQAIDTTLDDYRTVSSLPMSAGTTSTTASAVSYNPTGSISATTVQTAIDELDSEKVGYELGENGIVLDNAMSADNKFSGIIIDGTAGATLAIGDLIYLDPTDSRWELADANSASGADGDARGILGICALAAASDGDATKILLQGIVKAATPFPDITVNGPLYVSETAGDITHTAPTTTDAVVRVVGFGFAADTIYFFPASNYITAA